MIIASCRMLAGTLKTYPSNHSMHHHHPSPHTYPASLHLTLPLTLTTHPVTLTCSHLILLLLPHLPGYSLKSSIPPLVTTSTLLTSLHPYAYVPISYTMLERTTTKSTVFAMKTSPMPFIGTRLLNYDHGKLDR